MSDESKSLRQYEVLDANKVVDTLDLLSVRISERFPESGLFGVSRRLHQLASQAKQRSISIGRPFWQLRILTAVVVVSMMLPSLSVSVISKPPSPGSPSLVPLAFWSSSKN